MESDVPDVVSRWTRRKPSFKATEFLAYLATIAGVLIASAVDETIDARPAWILVAALGIGYMPAGGLGQLKKTRSGAVISG